MSNVSAEFESRFRSVVQRMRWTQTLTIVGWLAVGVLSVLVALSAADYVFETGWNLRAAIVCFAVVASLSLGGVQIVRGLRRWNRKATAARVEDRFEDLGQSVRTVVQYRDRQQAEGVSTSLLGALNSNVEKQTEDLRLSEAVATGPLKFAVTCLAAILLCAGFALATSWDWRMAASRALLGNTPYTSVEVAQGDIRVDEKSNVKLEANVLGRVDRDTALRIRKLPATAAANAILPMDDDSETGDRTQGKQVATEAWETRALTTRDAVKSETRLVSYSVNVKKVKEPFEYQVVSGKYKSPIYRVDVRYPLAIQAFDIRLDFPEYTGLTDKSLSKGSFEAVEGTIAQIAIELDHAPESAWLEMRPILLPVGEEPAVERVPLAIDGVRLSTTLELVEDRYYEVHAEARDGTILRPNRQRIRAHEDRAPRIAFETPAQLTEVHPLAELLMKMRISDDYGLRRGGIVFQRNNESEYALEDIEYAEIELEDGRLTPQTKATIESLFPLEYFDLTVNDSISFYGYAEDNRPDNANRNETDLHFIDVRPFRREYAQPDPEGLNGMGNRGDNPNRRSLPAINDMIARERFVLNRTMQMQRQSERRRGIDATAIDNLIRMQNEGSDLTFQMAQVAEEIEERFGIDDDGRISELLFQAREHMLGSIDSLSGSEFDVAKLQEKDALQSLVNARQRLDEPIRRGNRGQVAAARAALRRAFRRMGQNKRPRSNQQRAKMVVQRLRQAAAQQEFLMDKMSDLIPPEIPEDEEEPEEQEQDEMPADEEEEQLEDQPDESDQEEMQDGEDDERRNEMRRDIEEDQLELADEVQDIAEMIEELEQLSSLANQRTSSALAGSNSILDAWQRGNMRAARAAARASAARLEILADNIAGVTANEASKRIEIARDLGMFLSDELRDVESEAGRAESMLDKTDAEGDQLTELEEGIARPLAEASEEQAEVARTIKDILDSIVDPEQGIQDSEDLMVTRLESIMESNDLEQNIGRTQRLPEMIDSLEWTNVGAEADDLADRFEIVSQRLDAMHRELLSPRLEQLRRLEKRALVASAELKELQSNDQINRWHLKADGLLEDLESAEVAEAEAQSMTEAMEEAGWNSNTSWDWDARSDGKGLDAPGEYAANLSALISELQRHIRELTTVDAEVVNTGAVPPQYKPFVDRYIEMLSGVKIPEGAGEE